MDFIQSISGRAWGREIFGFCFSRSIGRRPFPVWANLHNCEIGKTCGAIAYFPFWFSGCASSLKSLSALTYPNFSIPAWLPSTWWVHGVYIRLSYV